MVKTMKIKPLAVVLGLIFTTVGLWYLTWGLDLIPDATLMMIGYLDDAGVILLLYLLFRRFNNKTLKYIKR